MSIIVGYDATARCTNSISIGTSNTATGTQAIAVGYNAITNNPEEEILEYIDSITSSLLNVHTIVNKLDGQLSKIERNVDTIVMASV